MSDKRPHLQRPRRRPPFRRAAAPVLLVWTAALVLGWLQPCCEAVLAAIPHDHDDVVADAAHEHHQRHERHGAGGDGVPAHQHCARVDTSSGDPPIPIAPRSADDDGTDLPPVDVAVTAATRLVVSARSLDGAPGLIHERSPPIYLLTRRLLN